MCPSVRRWEDSRRKQSRKRHQGSCERQLQRHEEQRIARMEQLRLGRLGAGTWDNPKCKRANLKWGPYELVPVPAQVNFYTWLLAGHPFSTMLSTNNCCNQKHNCWTLLFHSKIYNWSPSANKCYTATTILYSLDLYDKLDTTGNFLLASLCTFLYWRQNVQAGD